MTRERAIEVLKAWDLNWSDAFTANEFQQAFAMAISALEKNENAEEWYKLLCEKWNDGKSVLNAPKGMTNGEVIKAMFPNISVYEHGSTYSVNNEYNFNSTWWNLPYQKGGE